MNTTTVDSRFWDRIAQRYSRRPVADEAAYQQTLDRVRARLSPRANVLELGCGTGTTALKLAPHAEHITATDVSANMIDIAQAKAKEQRVDNVRFVRGTVQDDWLTAGSFDVVMTFNLIHLLQDMLGSLKRMHELLTPDGLFVSKTPCVGDMNLLVRGVIPIMRVFGQAPFVNFIGKARLQQAVVESGFEIIETGLYPAKSHSLYIVARKAEGSRV